MDKKRIVIKVGTGTLRADGHLSDFIFFSIASQIAQLKREGYEVILTSSGAVDAAKEWLLLLGKDFSMFNPGELSSIGTSRLLGYWERAFLPHSLVIATGWLTHSVWNHRSQRENLQRSAGKLSGLYTVPIINENDLLSRTELKNMKRGEGDNDYLGRRVAVLLKADAYLILTESGGIFNNADPSHPSARRYLELDGRTTFRLGRQNGGKSKTGMGGPQPKINQVSFCFRKGMQAAIAGVHEEKVIVRFAHEELVGTTITNRTILAS
ncbi:MAG: hypothetical protein Q7R93_03600 [bacterium]|nr:hypothetical protein [bacterium]